MSGPRRPAGSIAFLAGDVPTRHAAPAALLATAVGEGPRQAAIRRPRRAASGRAAQTPAPPSPAPTPRVAEVGRIRRASEAPEARAPLAVPPTRVVEAREGLGSRRSG